MLVFLSLITVYISVAPYFKVREDDAQLTVVLPAGRTVKLACLAGGKPDPQVVWQKDGKLLIASTVRSVGGNYKLRKWTLEMEDAAHSDSGDYVCEVCNRRFDLSIHFLFFRYSIVAAKFVANSPLILSNDYVRNRLSYRMC